MNKLRRRARFGGRGLTVAETLVAILILLIGIFAVAAGFPRLIRVINGSKIEAINTRLAQRALDRLSSDSDGLPFAVTQVPNLAAGTNFILPEPEVSNPYVFALLNAPLFDLDPTEPNALNDVHRVIGEEFTFPAPAAGAAGTPAFYAPLLGPVQPGSVSVYEPIELELLGPPGSYPNQVAPLAVPDDLNGDGLPDRGTFLVTPTGQAFDLDQDGAVADWDGDGTGDELIIVFPNSDWISLGTPPASLWAEITYTWVETGAGGGGTAASVHEVHAERIALTQSASDALAYIGTVAAWTTLTAQGISIGIVPDSVHISGLRYFAEEAPAGVIDPGEFALVPLADPGDAGSNLGLLLSFNPSDTAKTVPDPTSPTGWKYAGPQTLRVDYTQRLEPNPADETGVLLRREPLMVEDLRVPLSGYPDPDNPGTLHFPVQFSVAGIDDEGTIFANANVAVPVAAVDLTSGSAFTFNRLSSVNTLTILRRESDAPEADEEQMYDESVVDFPRAAGVAPGYLDPPGHQVRFYYRQIDETTVQLFKPPDYFIEQDIFLDPSDPTRIADQYLGEVYRLFALDGNTATVYFPNCYAGLSVNVDYDYITGFGTGSQRIHQVRGELYTIAYGRRPLLSGESANTVEYTTHLALRGPWEQYRRTGEGINTMRVRVRTVRGASVKARTWWRSETGMLKRVDVDSIIRRPAS